MNKVAIYVRVSTQEQANKETINAQIDFAEKYCDLHSLNIYKIYKDDGISGTIPLDKRPSGQELIQDVQNKYFDTLYIYKLDRLGRDTRVILNAIHLLEGINCQIKSMTEPFDTVSPTGKFMITVLAGTANLERENILERSRMGTNRLAKQGKWMGGIVPYGYYVNEDNELQINDSKSECGWSESEIIEKIFTLLVEEKYSSIKIAKWLNDMQIPTHYTKGNRKLKKGKRKVNTENIWRPARVRNIIRSTTYKGIHYYGKRSTKERELIERKVPAIISPEAWEKAQMQLKNNATFSTRNRKNWNYLLSSLIVCGNCGHTFHGKTYKKDSGKGYKYYYVCYGKMKHTYADEKKCNSKFIKLFEVEDYIWNECLKVMDNPQYIISNTKNKNDSLEKTKSIDKEIQTLQNQLDNLENEKQSILDLFRKKIIRLDDLEKQLNKIENEHDEKANSIISLKNKIKQLTKTEDKIKNANKLLLEMKKSLNKELTFEMKKNIIQTLIKKITAHTVINADNQKELELEIEWFI